MSYETIMKLYRQFVYEVGALGDRNAISAELLSKKREKNHQLIRMERFRLRTRWFTDSGVIGTKAYVSKYAREFNCYFQAKHQKKPRRIYFRNGEYFFAETAD